MNEVKQSQDSIAPDLDASTKETDTAREKLYTQAEVDEIVRQRLEEERAQTVSELTPEEQRAAELDARELNVQKKELLSKYEYIPHEDILKFFDGIDTSNISGFQNALDWLLDLSRIIIAERERNREKIVEEMELARKEKELRNEYELRGESRLYYRDKTANQDGIFKRIFKNGGYF